jgi:electron transfer flavoprotein alpha subunit
VVVFADFINGRLHPVTLELLGKAHELVKVTKQKVFALIIGYQTQAAVTQLLAYGADEVYVYDHAQLASFSISTYVNAFADFVTKIKPSAILIGATNYGRSIGPRIAAKFNTGMTADCTALEMKENTDLIQIRPAFGGNIMAMIKTTTTRPQICTARYKVFDKIQPLVDPKGKIISMAFLPEFLTTDSKIMSITAKPKELDLTDADIIVVAGRGFKNKNDLVLAQTLADTVGGQLGCTRPLVENG